MLEKIHTFSQSQIIIGIGLEVPAALVSTYRTISGYSVYLRVYPVPEVKLMCRKVTCEDGNRSDSVSRGALVGMI